MNKLKKELKKGIFYAGWENFFISIGLIFALYFTSKIYEILNHGPNVIFMKSYFDSLIPVIPIFIIPYDSIQYFIYASLLLLLIFRIRFFKSLAFSMILVWFVSYTFYFFAQSFVLRPHLTGNGYFVNMIRAVYASDHPYNDFPSLHTSLSTLVAFHWIKVNKKIGIPVAIWAALIVASTLFVKQHYLADVVIGLTLSFSVSRLFLKYVAKERI